MNEKMKGAWNVALDILKPSKKDLEHGLALHGESVVVDAYGFTPLAPLRGEVLRARFDLATPEERGELGTEARLTAASEDVEVRAEFMEAWHAAGVSAVIVNSGEEGQSLQTLLKRIAYRTCLIDSFKGSLMKAIDHNDIVRAKQNGTPALMFTTNGIPLVEEWRSIEGELSFIRLFHHLGVRMMHLTYNRRNMLGDGCAEPSDAGLSEFGRTAIAELNREGMIVDVAHSGRRTGCEAAQFSAAPIVASHTVCAAVNEHCRAKPDHLLRAVASTGGFIGICAIPAFLGGSGDIAAFLNHIDHAVKTVGADHIAIGTDRAYSSCIDDDEAFRGFMWPSRKQFADFWPKDDALFEARWNDLRMSASLEWTNFPLFTVGLVQRGHSDDDIRKIIGGTVLRVLADVAAKAENNSRKARSDRFKFE